MVYAAAAVVSRRIASHGLHALISWRVRLAAKAAVAAQWLRCTSGALPESQSTATALLWANVSPGGQQYCGLAKAPYHRVNILRSSGSARPPKVGTTLLSSDEASAAGMKGKGLRILHAYGDMLWESGPKIVPPGFEKDHVASVIASAHIAKADHAAPCEPEATAVGAAETRSTDASTAHVRITRRPPLALRGL